jgi:O-antigen biosynthesis protein
MARTKFIDLELSRLAQAINHGDANHGDLKNLGSYRWLRAVVRFRGVPLGEITLSIQGGECSWSQLFQAIFPQFTPQLCQQLLSQQLLNQPAFTQASLNPQPIQDKQSAADLQGVVTDRWRMPTLISHATSSNLAPLTLPPLTPQLTPQLTIALVVRTAALESLVESLKALQQLDYKNLEVLVIEALPADDRVQDLVQSQFADFQYLRTSVPSWNAARNLAIEKAEGEIIAFTDDRARVDCHWATAIVHTFAAYPDVMAVTGWILPAAIEQDGQTYFENAYSLDRGAQMQWHRWVEPPNWMALGTMSLGNGMNMALRRSVCDRIGRFDLALDVADSTWNGGDLELWSRLLLAGETLLYQPAALVRWQLPQTEPEIRQYLRQEMLGLYSYLKAGQQRFPQLGQQWRKLGFWKWTRLCMALVRPYGTPRSWIGQELRAVMQAMLPGKQYVQGLNRVGALPPTPTAAAAFPSLKSKAVRLVDIAQPLADLTDVTNYWGVCVYVQVGQKLLGQVLIENKGATISRQRLAEAIAQACWMELLAIPYGGDRSLAWLETERAIEQHWCPQVTSDTVIEPPETLPLSVPVSVIITTCDRPDDLRNCLHHLIHQQSPRNLEIIVADNRPASGITKPIVESYMEGYPGLRYVAEPRPGGAYGRNAAIVASTGDIVVTVDDDVTVPQDWLEKLLAPMVRPEVMAVMGNVLPLELDTQAQDYFEKYRGGLGNGFQRFEADGAWLNSFTDSVPPVWELGVSANAAFRATIFSHPEIGLMDEVLGPGMPTVGGEENYLVYKILKAGFTAVYEPDAFAWHRHRRDMAALYRQVKGHMQGGASFLWVLWFQEGDRRGLRQMLWHMPKYLLEQRVLDRIRGKHDTPWPIIWSEIVGYLNGFTAYWKSVKIVKQRGRSAPYVPVKQR